MSEDWAAVAKAINERVTELGWRQRELAERSHVSQAVVREIQHHVVERRRSTRTLEALSLALDWHARHLHAVLAGEPPPGRRSPLEGDGDRLWSRLDTLERRIADIADRLDTMDTNLSTVAEHIRNAR